jgi:hypothetical protein
MQTINDWRAPPGIGQMMSAKNSEKILISI